MHYQPLRVRYNVSTPSVGFSYPLHLDSLIAYAAVEFALSQPGHDPARLKLDLVNEVCAALPIAKEVRGQQYCYKASALLPVKVGLHQARMFTQETDAEDLAHRVGCGELTGIGQRGKGPFGTKIDTSRGPLKNSLEFYPTRMVSVFEGFLVADLDQVEAYLNPDSGFISHLGSKRRLDHGRISGFHIEVCDEANTRWMERILPWDGPGLVPMQATVVPPYTEMSTRQLAYANPAIFK